MADDVVREPQGALEVVEGARLGQDLEDHVEALGLVVDLVGEAAPAPLVGGGGARRPAVSTSALIRLMTPDDGRLVEVTVEDDHQFVRSHREHHLPLDPARPGPRTVRSRVLLRADMVAVRARRSLIAAIMHDAPV